MSDLAVHLRNHDAAAAGGVDFARRVARRHRDAAVGPELARIADDVREDHALLRQVMDAVSTRPGLVLPVAARVGERLGRLKPNGHLVIPSPVSDLLELEALRGAVTAKRAGWDTLLVLAEHDPRLPADLLLRLRERADDQAARLEEVQRTVAASLAAEVESR